MFNNTLTQGNTNEISTPAVFNWNAICNEPSTMGRYYSPTNQGLLMNAKMFKLLSDIQEMAHPHGLRVAPSYTHDEEAKIAGWHVINNGVKLFFEKLEHVDYYVCGYTAAMKDVDTGCAARDVD